MSAADQLPSPRFAAGSHVLVKSLSLGWIGPYTVVGTPLWGSVTPPECPTAYTGWFYRVGADARSIDPAERCLAQYYIGENCLRPYDPPAPEPYAVLLERLRSPQRVAA